MTEPRLRKLRPVPGQRAACTAWRTGNGATRANPKRGWSACTAFPARGATSTPWRSDLAQRIPRGLPRRGGPRAGATAWPTPWATPFPPTWPTWSRCWRDWTRSYACTGVGTSMGGLIGLGLASLPSSRRCSRSWCSTTSGPPSSSEALARIGTYLGQPAHWKSVGRGGRRVVGHFSQSFGPHTREQWLELTRPQLLPRRRRLQAALRPRHRGALSAPSLAEMAARRRSGAVGRLRPAARCRCCCCVAPKVRPVVEGDRAS